MSKDSVSLVSSSGFYTSTCGYCNSAEEASSRFGMRATSLNCKVIFSREQFNFRYFDNFINVNYFS